MGYLIAAIVALFVLSRSGLSLGGGASAVNTPPQGYVVPPQPVVAGVNPGSVQSGVSALSTFATAGSSLAKAIPIIGAGLAALLSVFEAASAKRAAEARSENAAVAQAVPGWDAMVAAIVQAYNSGAITAGGVTTALGAAWNNYWAEVGPQVQPGRNGCQSGQKPPFPQRPTISYCGGSYGAGCCVAYDDISNSNYNMLTAVSQTENTGKPASASILPVFGSKYGGINRAAYTVTFVRPNTLFGL